VAAKNVRDVKSGSQALWCTPIGCFRRVWRSGAEFLAAFTSCTTTGNRGQLAVSVGRGQCFVAELRRRAFLELDRLGAQHQVREIEVPGVRRHVRALRHVADVAQVALVDDLPVVLLVDAVHFHRRALVDEVEQVGNALHRLTQRRQPWQMSKTRSISFRQGLPSS
jgi:hypothetical protein